MKKIITTLFLMAIVLYSPLPVRAQGGTEIEIIGSTMPIDNAIKDEIISLLESNPPVDAQYYVITYHQSDGIETLVSLAALPSASLEWVLDDALWIGTIILDSGAGSVEYLSGSPSLYKMASPNQPAEGGGPEIAFPWQAGKAVVYGTLGVHGEGEFGTSGMYAIDALVGADLGSNVASANVYASDAGTIDYVCNDGTSVAVRTYNAATGDNFLYVHLLDNEILIIGTAFSKGSAMGNLKFGTFSGNCGGAQQQAAHAHVHWMFNPKDGYFQAENCVISIATSKIMCSGSEINPGEFLIGGGGDGTTLDDIMPTTMDDLADRAAGGQMTFFDYLLLSTAQLADSTLLSILPEHTSQFGELQAMIQNSAIVILRIAYVLLVSNINVGPLMAILGFLLSFYILMSIIKSALSVIKIVKLFI